MTKTGRLNKKGAFTFNAYAMHGNGVGEKQWIWRWVTDYMMAVSLFVDWHDLSHRIYNQVLVCRGERQTSDQLKTRIGLLIIPQLTRLKNVITLW